MGKKGKQTSWFVLGLVVLTFLTAQAQEDQPVKTPSAESVAINGDTGLIVLNAQKIDIRTLLDQIAQSAKVNIVASGDVDGEISVNLYRVSLEEALDSILIPNGFAWERRGNFVYVMLAEAIENFRKPRELEVVLYRLSYFGIEEAKQLLALYLSPKGEIRGGKAAEGGNAGAAAGGGGGEEEEAETISNVIAVKDYPEVHEKIRAALQELDIQPKQALVEATILEVTLDDSHKLGVDFKALGGIDFDLLGAESDLFSVTGAKADGAMIKDGFNAFGTKGFTGGNAEGFNIGILKDDLSVFIEALETMTDTNVLANPKVLAVNRKEAQIIIGGRLGYYGAETLSEGGISQKQVKFLDIGTQLKFTPFIGEDGYIRMEIHPERSDGVVDSTTLLPSETTSEVKTNILVKDGNTVVIGGLIEQRDTRTVSQVPFLGSLPLVGWLFRKEETGTRRVEIVILITPRITDPSRSDDKGQEIKNDFMDKKNTFRHSFHAWTRTAAAERHLELSRNALAGGRTSWAAFHIWRAGNLDPQNPDLGNLKRVLRDAQKGIFSGSGSGDEDRVQSLKEYIRSQVK